MSNHEESVQKVSGTVAMISHGAGILIDVAIADGKRFPITKLSQDLAEKLNVDKVFCYHIVSQYIKERGDLEIKMGPNGGIQKKSETK